MVSNAYKTSNAFISVGRKGFSVVLVKNPLPPVEVKILGKVRDITISCLNGGPFFSITRARKMVK